METFSNYIEIDGTGFDKPKYYEQEVLKVLRQINNTAVGMLVLYELKKTGRKLKIKPAKDLVSANANPNNSHPWSSTGRNNFCALPGESPLEYLPGNYYSKTGTFIQIEPFFGPDDVMVHEIFHKARMFNGTMCKTPTNDPYDDMEEFFAITITNIYLSELGKNHRLRAGHSVLIEQLTMSSQEFADKYDQRMSILRREMSDFCGFMAGVESQFNPIREAYNDIMRIRNSPPVGNAFLPSI